MKAREAIMSAEAAEIVVIDDDPVQIDILTDVLSEEGYRVYPFRRADKALEQVVAYPPAALIVDLHMPYLSGNDFIEQLHAALKDETPPCLVLSASLDQREITRCYEAGARDFLPKPCPFPVLLAKLRLTIKDSLPRLPRAGDTPLHIGRYTVVEEIGRGGMGVVYRVLDWRQDRSLALKTLWTRSKSIDPVLRFRREVDVLSLLQHPNLVRFYEAGRDGELLFYTMDLVKGQPLSKIVDRGPLPPERVRNLLVQFATALSYLHEQSVIHRDLKPANIIVQPNGVPVLIDFGLAKIVSDHQLTSPSVHVGTPGYMAPELIRGTETDARSDLFSLGLIALELLSGKQSVSNDNPYTCMALLAEGRYARAKSMAHVPQELARIVDRLVEPLPSRRWQSAEDLLEALTLEGYD